MVRTTLYDNATTFRHLRALSPPLSHLSHTKLWQYFAKFQSRSGATLENLLIAAPFVTRVEADIAVNVLDAVTMPLGRAASYGLVCVRRLRVSYRPASFSAFLANARRLLTLSELELGFYLKEGNVEALVHFALNKPLTALSLTGREIPPAAMPSLTRLINGHSLTALDFDELLPSIAFCSAVAAAPLVRLYYEHAGLFDTLTTGLSLLGAVTRHPTLRYLSLSENFVPVAGRVAVGAALGLLVATDSPLVTLNISLCNLGYDGSLPFIHALPHNTHLHRLECEENDFTQVVAARLLAAVRANASLIYLRAMWAEDDPILMPELLEAVTVVAARANAVSEAATAARKAACQPVPPPQRSSPPPRLALPPHAA